MGIRSLKTASIANGVKRSKFWDQTTALGNFESIASFVFTGAETSVTFASISSQYDHLQIRFYARRAVATTANDDMIFVINDRTTSDSMYARMYSTGTAQSGSVTTGDQYIKSGIGIVPNNNTAANYYGAGIFDLFNANNATQKKIFQGFYGTQPAVASTDARVAKVTHLSQDTARISKIICQLASNAAFIAGSTISLYGVKA